MRKFLGVLFTVVLVFPLILSTLVIYSLSTWAMDRKLYIDTLSSPEVQAQLFSDKFIEKMVIDNLGEIEGSDSAAVGTLFRSLFSEQYFTNQTTIMVNQFFDFLEGKSNVLTLQLDLTEIKAVFSGPNQQELLENLAQALPACQENQPTQGLGRTLCKPDAISEEDFIEYYLKTNLPILMALIQDNVTIVGPVSMPTQFQNVPAPFQQFLNLGNLKTTIFFLAGLTLLLWSLTALIAGKNGKERLLWLGWTMIIPAILVLIMGLTAESAFFWNMLQYGIVQWKILESGNLLFTLLPILQTLFSKQISSSFILSGGFSSAIGLGFIAWGAVTRTPKAKKIEE